MSLQPVSPEMRKARPLLLWFGPFCSESMCQRRWFWKAALCDVKKRIKITLDIASWQVMMPQAGVKASL